MWRLFSNGYSTGPCSICRRAPSGQGMTGYELGYLLRFGLVSVIMSSWRNDLSVDMVIARNVHHVSYLHSMCRDRPEMAVQINSTGSLSRFPPWGKVIQATFHVTTVYPYSKAPSYPECWVLG